MEKLVTRVKTLYKLSLVESFLCVSSLKELFNSKQDYFFISANVQNIVYTFLQKTLVISVGTELLFDAQFRELCVGQNI